MCHETCHEPSKSVVISADLVTRKTLQIAGTTPRPSHFKTGRASRSHAWKVRFLRRVVPDVAQALAALADRDEITGEEDLGFPAPGGVYLEATALRERYKKALRAAEFRPLRFHDLRHTFGTLAIPRGRGAAGAGLDGPFRYPDHAALRPPP